MLKTLATCSLWGTSVSHTSQPWKPSVHDSGQVLCKADLVSERTLKDEVVIILSRAVLKDEEQLKSEPEWSQQASDSSLGIPYLQPHDDSRVTDGISTGVVS